MTTDKNIQDLANENQRLMAENTKLRQFIRDFAEWDYSGQPFAGNEKEFAFRRFQNAARSMGIAWESPTAKRLKASAPKPDLSFTAHEDATSHGCQSCGNEHKSLNEQGYCSSCWTVWNS